MELLPCPFCGSNEYLSNTEKYNRCLMCDAKCIREKWNTRHSPWISVKKQLPEDNQKILVYDGNEIHTSKFLILIYKNETTICFENTYYDADCYINTKNVTHWMPLIPPPKETE